MTSNVVGRWVSRVGLAGGLAFAVAGCPDDAHEITEVASAPSFDFPVAGAFVEPVGSFAIDRVVLADIDTTVTDAFGRTASFLIPGASFFTCGGPCPAWEFPIRNGSEDTRLPALQDADASGLIAITPDSIFGVPFVVFTLGGLKASTGYTFTLERLALTVNQGLDAANVLLNDPSFGGFQTSPDGPDALASLGGTPGATLGSNYYEIGGFTSDGTGASGFRFFIFDGGGTNDVLETNSLQSFGLPQYNYLVLYEGSPAAGIPVMRAQVGVDLDASGSPINNSLAPFPTGPLTTGQMLRAPGGAGRPDSIEVTFNKLEALAGGAAYEAWLVNPLTGSMVPATGTYNRIKIIAERDPITGEVVSTRDSFPPVETVTGTASFVGGNQEDGFRHQLIIGDASLAGGAADTLGFHTHLMLTIDSSPGDGTPAAARPVWIAYTDQNNSPVNFFDDSVNVTGVTKFGTFNVANAAQSQLFGGQGVGLGGVRDVILSVDLENLSRPPVGYSYVAWLVPETGAPVRLPDITGPPPERVSLVDADVQLVEGVVTVNGILESNFRVDASAAGIDFTGFPTFLVTLEAKASDPGMGPIPAQIGTLPEPVLNP